MSGKNEIIIYLQIIVLVVFFSTPIINLVLSILSIFLTRFRNSGIPYILLAAQMLSFIPVVMSIVMPEPGSAIPFYSALAYPLLLFFFLPIVLFNAIVTFFYWRGQKL
ncbi:hypothetical protein A3A54_00785 [Candidatus Curtissbacteria bacterium RIFCSPLOWO2_01_FULL_39_62]|uniref:Uncharacterized protein n=1 Tax=Candidatus Yanofskybacteria bacterium RIFCSPHIGHO2_02_FULL_43_22 TaxID=1802681 RepID=A0A1F8FN73_9BACT|nr:MAG: hypothetical protein A3A54_00785 [Candidatus Curtissbacteria bacterium RIFCSPLOWO2_01_FULL_39_62]OGN13896.1 MAG: hypothetical protein A3J47_00730 [Candidatus Yanofskybacteria bacterium RIFCSPHIGHO2_02_FULL_43_22]